MCDGGNINIWQERKTAGVISTGSYMVRRDINYSEATNVSTSISRVPLLSMKESPSFAN